MPVARINPNLPIVYGGSVIQPLGNGSGSFYVNPQRALEIPDESSLGFYQTVDGRYLSNGWVEQGGLLAASGDTSGLVSGGDAIVYYPPLGPTQHHVIAGLSWGFSAAPTSGSISVESPSGVPVFGPIPISAAGPGYDDFATPLKGLANQGLLIRLRGSAGTTQGTVSAKGHRVE